MNGVYAFIAVFSLGYLIIGFWESAVTIGVGMFVLLFSLPLAAGCSQVIWMSKVEPQIQGRVFAIRGMIATAISPLAYAYPGLRLVEDQLPDVVPDAMEAGVPVQ
jgi:DHA3 family macrolide efflux protein-like MFS transporter